jgi:hypothetical protein
VKRALLKPFSPVLTVFQQAIAAEFDRVARDAPSLVGDVGGILFDLSRFHRAIVAVQFCHA